MQEDEPTGTQMSCVGSSLSQRAATASEEDSSTSVPSFLSGLFFDDFSESGYSKTFSEFSRMTNATDPLEVGRNHVAHNLSCATSSSVCQSGNISHACAYCGVSNASCVVKCGGCERWFCNGRGTASVSHAISHLVRSKHKEVFLHPESPLGDTALECYSCGCRNVFLLGFIPAKTDSVVVLLCRQPCASSSVRDHPRWDLSQWLPLIEDKSFLPWLVRVPSEEEQKNAKQLTFAQITRIEEAWKEKPQAKVDEIEAAFVEAEPQAVKLCYDNFKQYVEVFSPLIQMEADYDRRLKEAQHQKDVTIRWDTGLNMRRIAHFTLTKVDVDVRITPGDEVKLVFEPPSFSTQKKRWAAIGSIVKAPPTLYDEIVVELEPSAQPIDATQWFSVEFIWKATSYQRMKAALKKFTSNSSAISPLLRSSLLSPSMVDMPQSIDSSAASKFQHLSSVSVPSLAANLNQSQVDAIREALCSPLSLIQGPPGTGKTVTSATLVYHMVQMGMGPILVCAPSNVATDQLTEKIHSAGLRVLRITAKNREALESSVTSLTIIEQAKNANLFPELAKLLALREETGGEMNQKDEARFKTLRQQTEKALIRGADVICCTCVGAGDLRLLGMKFRSVIVDEATQACEPECLIPLTLGAERVVLIGDHQQLGPVIMCKKAAKAGFTQSLFERLVLSGWKPLRLQVQYRMHPALSEFPSNIFYEGILQNGVSANDRPATADFPWPNPSIPMFFHVNIGQEELSSSGTSYLNRTEAISCEKIITRLLKSGVPPSQIGVITPYEGQRAYILHHMSLNGPLGKSVYSSIEVASVDAFQGREKDYVVFSCVRSNDHQGIGFLSDFRRLNVALTRARFGLIVIGNARILSRHPLWHQLILHFKDRSLLMEGQIGALRQSNAALPRIRATSNKNPELRPATPKNLSVTPPTQRTITELVDFSMLSINSIDAAYEQDLPTLSSGQDVFDPRRIS